MVSEFSNIPMSVNRLVQEKQRIRTCPLPNQRARKSEVCQRLQICGVSLTVPTALSLDVVHTGHNERLYGPLTLVIFFEKGMMLNYLRRGQH